MSEPHGKAPQIDPVTGYGTTGHDWNGIHELNTPFPKIVIWALVLTFVYSLIAWVLLPAWPVGRDYTRGILGLDQHEMALERLQKLETGRTEWLSRFKTEYFAALQADAALMARAMPAAERLFLDNCAACHGNDATGGPGFPALNDHSWLWGGDPDVIAETLHVGINAPNDDTRWAQMPAFDWLERSEMTALAEYVSALPQGTADANAPAATLFADNCSACHGETGAGGLANGAPSLTDGAVIYGQDPDTVMQTLRHGRQGVMPAWADRLSEAEINLLAIYVADLSGNKTEPGE
ncbi:cytochrome-c oxidase, cbb3-type subunit III [Rhodobacteraceae bacterium F11138]|nr:cytochrome-c oxidase, cbb3-type subunit III [Rhodobacteraceae bacterium F11138]